MLMNFLIILGWLSIVASAVTIFAVLSAEIGYEDDSGFHFGTPISHRVRGGLHGAKPIQRVSLVQPVHANQLTGRDGRPHGRGSRNLISQAFGGPLNHAQQNLRPVLNTFLSARRRPRFHS
jgi:hypothetical protein